MAPSRTEVFQQERSTLFDQQSTSRGGDGSAVPVIRRRPASTSTDATAAEAAAIQQSLQRTQKLLQSELARVSAVQRAIEDDEKLLKETMHTHKTLGVSAVKKALTELERAQQHERRVLAGAVLLFFSVVAYVLWCRVLIRIPFLDRVLELVWGGVWQLVVAVQSKLLPLQNVN